MYMMMNRKEAGTEVDRESGELNLKKKKNKKKRRTKDEQPDKF